jgi:GAF domain-containing protein
MDLEEPEGGLPVIKRVNKLIVQSPDDGAYPQDGENQAPASPVAEESFAEIGRVLNTTAEFGTACDLIENSLARLIPFDRYSVVSIDPERRTFELLRQSRMDADSWDVGSARDLRGTVAEAVFDSGKAQVIDIEHSADVLKRFPAMHIFAEAGYHSSLNVPIVINGETRGILFFGSRQKLRYTDRHIELAGRCAHQLAGALAKADLIERVERQAHESEVLAHIGRIVGSTLELEEVYPLFVEKLLELFPADRVAITTIDSSGEGWTDQYSWGPGSSPLSGSLIGSATGYVVSTQSSLLLGNTNDANAKYEDFPGIGVAVGDGVKSTMVVPLISRRQAIGVIHVQSTAEAAYGKLDLVLAERVANQIVGAIATGGLYNKTTEMARIERALAETGKLISSSFEVDAIFPAVVELITSIVPADRVAIDVFDVPAGIWTKRYVWGTEIDERRVGDSGSLEGSAGAKVLQSKNPLIIDVAGQHTAFTDFSGLAPSARAGFRSAVTVPLISQAMCSVQCISSHSAPMYTTHQRPIWLKESAIRSRERSPASMPSLGPRMRPENEQHWQRSAPSQIRHCHWTTYSPESLVKLVT